MKSLLDVILNDSRYSVYHLGSIALFLLGFFVTFTASDLGPFAPLLVSTGIYLVVFSLLLQGVYWGKTLLRKMLGSWLAS